MKSIVYSYKNRKPVIMELDRYYYVKNKRELNNVILKLLDLDLDAVTSPEPENIRFPAVLKLDNGFGLDLKVVEKDALEVDLEKLLDVLESVK